LQEKLLKAYKELLALEEEKKEREAALAEARETLRKEVEEATRLRERIMTVEEAASKAREEAAFYEEVAADHDKEKVLIKADHASAREAFQEMKVECVKGEIARTPQRRPRRRPSRMSRRSGLDLAAFLMTSII